MNRDKESQSDVRFDPDPFSIAVAVIGAVGGAASIFTVVDRHFEKRRDQRLRRERVEILRASREVRTSFAELRHSYRVLLRRFVEPQRSNSGSADRHFGAARIMLRPNQLAEFDEVVASIFSALYSYYSSMMRLSYHMNLLAIDLDIPPVQALMKLRDEAERVLSRELSAMKSMDKTEHLLDETEKALEAVLDWILK